MPLVHHNTLTLALDLLGTDLQRANQTDFFLPLGLNGDNLTRFNGVFGVRETTTGRGEAGSHKCRTGENKANSTAVDLDGWEGSREGVDEAKVWDWRAIKGLKKQWGGIYCVEGCSFGPVEKLLSPARCLGHRRF